MQGRKYVMTMQEGKELQIYKGVVAHSVLAAAGFGGRSFSSPSCLRARAAGCMHARKNTHHSLLCARSCTCSRSAKTHAGAMLKVHRVTLEDFVLNMSRQGTPVYPKDACSILMMLNVEAGSSVLEV